MILLPSHTTHCAFCFWLMHSRWRTGCSNRTINTFTPHVILNLVTNFNYSLICIITVAVRLALMPISFHLFELRLCSDFQGRMKIRRKTKPIFIYATCVFPYTSFSCFLLRTTIDCCGYTLSILLSTVNYDTQSSPYPFSGLGIWEVYFVKGAFMKLQICAQLMATTCSCYCYLSCFRYNHILPPSPQKKKKSKRYLHSLWRKDNARNVSFLNLSRWQFNL